MDYSNIFSGLGDLTSSVSTIGIIAGWTILLLIIGLVAFLIVFFWFKYNIKVFTFEERAGGIIKLKKNRARKITKGFNVVCYKLFKSKKLLKPSDDLKQLYQIRGQDCLFLHKKSETEYDFISFDSKLSTLKAIPMEVHFWNSLRSRETVTKYNKLNWFKEYGGVIINFIGFLMMFVIILILFSQMKSIATQLGAVADALSRISVQTISSATPPP